MPKQTKFKIGAITVFKRPESGIWFYSFQHNGKKVRKTTKLTDATKAKKYVEQEIAPQLATDTYSHNDSKITLEQACEKYLKYCKPRVLDSTYKTNSLFATNRLKQDFKETRDIKSFAKTEMRDYLLNLDLPPNSIISYSKRFRSFFSYLVEDGIISKNPLSGIDKHLPKASKDIPKYHEKEEIESILSKAKEYDLTLYLLFILLRYTGVRIKEALSLKGENFDLKRKTLEIKARKEINFRPKSHQERIIPVPTKLIKLLKKHLKKDEWLISHDDNQHYSDAPKRLLNSFKEDCNIVTTFHRFRHSYAENWLRQGLDIYQLSKVMGHSSVKVTESSYGFFTVGRIQSTVETAFKDT